MRNTNITVIDEETRKQRIAQAWHYMVPIDPMPLEEMEAALGMVAYSTINAIWSSHWVSSGSRCLSTVTREPVRQCRGSRKSKP